jgi:MtN3 and saliva related transmembrane protein
MRHDEGMNMKMDRFNRATLAIFLPCMTLLSGCQDLTPKDRPSLLDPHMERSEVLGLAAGLGTTFAALPDLIAMLRRRSTAGMNPRMAAIMGLFQILWVFYGLLIGSRPVIIWNVIAIVVNFISVGAYFYFARQEKGRQTGS